MSNSETKQQKSGSKKNFLAGKRILMIEDDPYLREFYRRLLEREEMEISIADDGLEGYEQLTSKELDLVLLDVMLPRMTGIELLQKLSQEGVDHPPIIMLTELDQPGVEEKARSLGAAEYLAKHEMNGPELKRRIKSILDPD